MKQMLVPSLAYLSLCAGLLLGHARAQTTSKQKPSDSGEGRAARAATPNPADVNSLDSIIAALYEVISGPAGKARDWDRMHTLFVSGARLMPTSPVRPPGTPPDAPLNGTEQYATHIYDVDGYVERVSKFFAEQGFYEKEVARRVESYGHIVHIWSTYESRHSPKDTKPFARGVNSIQLMNDGKRWWIVSIFWEGETPQTPLPKKYLKSAR